LFLVVAAAVTVACQSALQLRNEVVRSNEVVEPALTALSTGTLVVLTDRHEIATDGLVRRPYSSFEVLNDEGALVVREANHLADFDESPARTLLRLGTYTARAWTSSGRVLERPFVIRAGQTTVVDCSTQFLTTTTR
jgi:hypothetical protein